MRTLLASIGIKFRSACFQILKGLQHFRYDNLSTDLMITMGLMNVLINRLELGIKDLKETHSTDRKNSTNTMRDRDDDDDIDMTFPKRVKMEFTPPRYATVCIYAHIPFS